MSVAGSAPAAIYLDTSVVVASTIDGIAGSEACAAFCDRLVDASSHVFFSQILRLELSQVLARLPKDNQVPLAVRHAYRLDRWDSRVDVRTRWLTDAAQRFEDLLARFADLSEIAFDPTIWRASLDVMAHFRLRSHDAVHIATARAAGVRDFATLDDDFRRVPDLRVWLLRVPSP